jgi:hypothetical protein
MLLFLCILRRWHEAHSAMLALSFSATFHAAEARASHLRRKTKKTQEEDIYFKIRARKREE